METKVNTPTHTCPRCGEWWIVEPIKQDIWIVVRFGENRVFAREQQSFAPECPTCRGVDLEVWLIKE